jgi:CSLREA domain-containing protein
MGNESFSVGIHFVKRQVAMAGRAILIVLTITLLGAITHHRAHAASIVVNSLADTAANDGVCTLREAIQSANLNTASGGAGGECPAGSDDPTIDVITFSVSGTITLGSPLPGIGDNSGDDPGYVTIDGDNNDNMVPDITIVRSGGDGLLIGYSGEAAINVTIDGLEIRGSGAGQGIDVARAVNLVIEDSYIHAGTNQGIRINNDDTSGVIIRRVRIGLDGTGAASGNGGNGIQINQGADNVTIEFSFISANGSDGIQVASGSTGHLFQNNFIGTNLAGTSCGASGGNPPWNTFGNGLIGIDILGNLTSSTIEDNVISCSGRSQLVGGSQGDGIEINGAASNGITIQNNFIGTNSSGANLGNHQSGIDIVGGDNTTIFGNTIAFNGFIATSTHQDGIEIGGSGTDGHTITRNSIYGNNGLGIDLDSDGVNANDALDPDSGSNEVQNYPVINSAANNGSGMYAVNYTWSFAAGEGPWTIEFFCNSDGDTEGRSYQDDVIIPAGSPTGTQTSSFTPVPGTCNSTANVITATATNSVGGGSTSEFSANFNPTAILLTGLRARADGSAAQVLVLMTLSLVAGAAATGLRRRGAGSGEPRSE